MSSVSLGITEFLLRKNGSNLGFDWRPGENKNTLWIKSIFRKTDSSKLSRQTKACTIKIQYFFHEKKSVEEHSSPIGEVFSNFLHLKTGKIQNFVRALCLNTTVFLVKDRFLQLESSDRYLPHTPPRTWEPSHIYGLTLKIQEHDLYFTTHIQWVKSDDDVKSTSIMPI